MKCPCNKLEIGFIQSLPVTTVNKNQCFGSWLRGRIYVQPLPLHFSICNVVDKRKFFFSLPAFIRPALQMQSISGRLQAIIVLPVERGLVIIFIYEHVLSYTQSAVAFSLSLRQLKTSL